MIINIFYSNITTGPFFLQILGKILSKFKLDEEPKILKFLKGAAKTCLNRFLIYERKRKRPYGFLKTIKLADIISGDLQNDRLKKEIFNEISLSQKRALLIELIKELFYLEN
jgi:hypothetical protein